MSSPITCFLILSLAIQVYACREFGKKEDDCSTCLHNCLCNSPRTIDEKTKDKEIERINEEAEKFAKEINKAVNEEIEKVNREAEKFVKEINKDKDNNRIEQPLKKGCPKCFHNCHCVKTNKNP
ncbi:hypothetical protein [Borrelia sp. RT1S]|uniref:hypothetical protein n=1 Tax=Borrelia sp. RT1S TaxID=2898580 RepID=UPI001E30B56A|nr:hypothetical protein [Borrelia sp. RT1S]UGQ17945.1 hypothetical protein LSO05_05795 [Borrelia sp. RT1S]